jgi:adenylate kinase family enzyme
MIVILGMAGAGKSTQCKKLCTEHGYQWIAVGELLRSLHRTEEQRAEMMHGLILDDNVVQPLVEAEIQRLGDDPELILDGCPRTRQQAEWLASQTTAPASCVIHLVVSDVEAARRLHVRGREDDSPEAVQKRFAGYHRDIAGVLSEFIKRGVPVHTFDADQPEDEVYAAIVSTLK